MLRTDFQLFRNTRQCFYTYVIFSIVSILLMILSEFPLSAIETHEVGVISGTLDNSLLAFIVFMYITYEYMSLSIRCHAEECLSVLPVSKNTQEGHQVLFCFLLNGLYCFIMLCFNIIFAIILHVAYPIYLLHIVKAIFLYLFLPDCIAILIGAILSHIQKSFLSYVLLVIIAFYATNRSEHLFYMYDKLYGLSDFTQFFNVNNCTQYGNLMPLDAHFAVKPFYILGILALILTVFFYRRTRSKKYWGIQAFLVCVITVSILIWKQPCGGYYWGYYDGEDNIYDDTEKIEQISDQDTFFIERYDMELDLSKKMDFTVTMTLSDNSCPEYDFTLCSLYPIHSVQDGDGKTLEYQRDGNFLTIKNTDSALNEVIIEYSGVNLNKYCVGAGGIYLPGNFPFYPLAGKRPVIYQGLCELPSEESSFHVTVNYKNATFSNLNRISDNVYEGNSNNFTIVSGFWKEKEINGFRMIYPYISASFNPEKNSFLLDGIRKYSNKKSENPINGQTYQMTGKTIIIAPFAYEGGNYMFASDTVLFGSTWDLEMIYNKYLMTGEWYHIDEMTEDEIQQLFEENPL